MKKTLLSAAALLATADASARFRPRQVSSDWTPARQTLAAMDLFADEKAAAAAPQPTSAPEIPDFLVRRDRDHTCGYISGEDNNPITCPGTATCVVNTRASVAGCCGAKCNVPTVCLPQASSAQGSTADTSSTLWCSGDDLPACATITYLDPQYSGYAGYFCDVSATLYPVYYSAFAAGVTTSGSSSRSSSSRSSSGTSTSPTPNGTPGANSGDNSPTPAPSSSSSSSGPPVGAIVGGVVGGVAAIGLIGLAVFFLIRASKSRSAHGQGPPAPPPAGPMAPQPTGPPPGMSPYSPQSTPGPQMAEHANLAPGMAGAYDPRSSVAKSPYEASVLSAPGSPPPPEGQQFVAYQPYNPQQAPPAQQMSPQNTGGWGQGFGGYGPQPHHLQQNPTGGSLSPQGTGYSGAGVPPPAGYAQAPVQPHQGYTAELPAERGDRELQELA